MLLPTEPLAGAALSKFLYNDTTLAALAAIVSASSTLFDRLVRQPRPWLTRYIDEGYSCSLPDRRTPCPTCSRQLYSCHFSLDMDVAPLRIVQPGSRLIESCQAGNHLQRDPASLYRVLQVIPAQTEPIPGTQISSIVS
jgi:hypothetical protein